MARRRMAQKKGKRRPTDARKRRGVKRFLKVLWTTVLLVGLCGSGYAFLDYVKTSPSFNVRNVRVTGTQLLDKEYVFEQSGITGNENILAFDAAPVKARVEALPYVKSCRVNVSFPDTITLSITERSPVASLILNTRSYELDAEAVVLREFAVDEAPSAPYFTNVEGLDFVEVGQPIDHPALRSAMIAWSEFSATNMAESATISEISPLAEDDIRMYFEDLPYEIRWGRGAFNDQARRLDLLFTYMDGALGCTEYLDLRWGDQLACK